MSKYTTEVRFICESKAGLLESKGFNDVDGIITTAAPLIFNFEFPIFDEAYRLPFEKMILRHFYVREIGLETFGLWQLKLWDKLNLIMPYYNKMYLSALLEFNPLYDVDYQINHSGNGTGTSSDTENITDSRSGSNSNTRWDLFSDTPQGGINGITADNDSVANNTYLTDARKITDSGSNSDSGTRGRTASGSTTTTDAYIDRVFGKRSAMSYGTMIKEFRQTFLKIDEMVCEELEPLFFGLWE